MKLFCFLCVMLFIVMLTTQPSTAQDVKLLQGNVSLIDEIPENFYGTWIVAAREISNTNPALYAASSIDVWTLTRKGNIIILCNPVSGAQAAVSIDSVEDNTIKFSRVARGDNEIGLETPSITLRGDTFDGTDKMVIKRYANNQLYREEVVEYRLKGKKVTSENPFHLVSKE